MTKRQRAERKLGNTIRANRGHFVRQPDGTYAPDNSQTAAGLTPRINRWASRVFGSEMAGPVSPGQ